MRIRPTGDELLATALSVLRESLLPNVPAAEAPAFRAIETTLATAADEPSEARVTSDALEAARVVLRDTLLTCLPKERQYDARLVAKAIAITAVERANGDGPQRVELAELSGLLDALPAGLGDDVELHQLLGLLHAKLAADIRAGRIDPGSPRFDQTYAFLRETTRRAVRESNPAYLETHGDS